MIPVPAVAVYGRRSWAGSNWEYQTRHQYRAARRMCVGQKREVPRIRWTLAALAIFVPDNEKLAHRTVAAVPMPVQYTAWRIRMTIGSLLPVRLALLPPSSSIPTLSTGLRVANA
eukprot:1607406-Rhodomonas_salina.1